MYNGFQEENIAFFISNEIRHFVKTSNDNFFKEINGCYFDEPIVQFASFNNPLFEKYKEIIGQYHFTPKEIFEIKFPERDYMNGTVICIVLPVNSNARISNRAEKKFGSREWALTRYYGDEIFIEKLAEHIIEYLQSNGYEGIAPSSSDLIQSKMSGQDISSNCSERHAAYAAGLGTFSINDGFITEKGIAVKLVSILTDANIPQSEQVYQNYQQNCLWCNKETCGACMKRCPVGAITAKGHDKIKCYMHCYGDESKEIAKKYGGSEKYGSGCGLCQTGVPCEFRNPLKYNE